jgi:hypothetical protein
MPPSHTLPPYVTGRPCAAVRPAIEQRNFRCVRGVHGGQGRAQAGKQGRAQAGKQTGSQPAIAMAPITSNN